MLLAVVGVLCLEGATTLDILRVSCASLAADECGPPVVGCKALHSTAGRARGVGAVHSTFDGYCAGRRGVRACVLCGCSFMPKSSTKLLHMAAALVCTLPLWHSSLAAPAAQQQRNPEMLLMIACTEASRRTRCHFGEWMSHHRCWPPLLHSPVSTPLPPTHLPPLIASPVVCMVPAPKLLYPSNWHAAVAVVA